MIPRVEKECKLTVKIYHAIESDSPLNGLSSKSRRNGSR